MKIVRQGFRVDDISDGITTVVVETESALCPASFSILSRIAVTENVEETERMPLSDLGALIEALQEVKRITDAESATPATSVDPRVTPAGDVEFPAEPERVWDREGDMWVRNSIGLYRTSPSVAGGPLPLNVVAEEYGPLKPIDS